MSDIAHRLSTWIKETETFKKKDPKAKEYRQTIKETGDQIGFNYGKIHNEEYTSKEEMQDLMMKVSQYSEEKRNAEKAYKDLMESNFKDFKEEYENIYDLAISEEGIDPQTLNHVLSVFKQFQSKKITNNQGMNQGISYMKKKFDLPDDFLNHLPE